MPEQYSSFAFYLAAHGGKLEEGEYAVFAPRAAAEIDLRSYGRARGAFDGAAEGDGLRDAVRRCECELVDIIRGYARLPAGVAAQDNDGLRMDFDARAGENEAAACARVCRKYLPRALLYAC